MGVALGLRIAQMITLNALAASNLAMQAGIAGATSEASKGGLTMGASALITIGAIMGSVLLMHATLGGLTSFLTGGEVKDTGLAMVHEGEFVTPNLASKVPGSAPTNLSNEIIDLETKKINKLNSQHSEETNKILKNILNKPSEQDLKIDIANVTSEFDKADPMFNTAETMTTGFV